MPHVTTFTVVPRLPAKLAKLRDICFNLAWCWDPESIELFFRIDQKLWNQTQQNAVHLLGLVSQERLEELAHDVSYTSQLDRVAARLDEYLTQQPWRKNNPDTPQDFSVAYFSAEFGIHESVSIYSGGLGVLAGDHLKSASDLGLPLAGVGLLYGEGYHRQTINADGWQQEHYPRNDFYNMPIEMLRDGEGAPLTVSVDFPDRQAHLRIWKLLVGRVPLYLLDSDFEANEPEDRAITSRLYGGDRDMRIRQEIVLGMGGVKALHAIGVFPIVYHMNEGHAAFMVLQRIKDLVKEEGLSVPQAMEAVKSASVFTTHTPVPAGNDMFVPEMVEHYFRPFCAEVGMGLNDLLTLGRQNPDDHREPFCMTVLAIKLSSHANGVSKLHGEVARSMWARTFPGVPEHEVPVTSITNGIHTRYWISRELAGLFDRYIGPGWVNTPWSEDIWSKIEDAPDGELWRTHERRRERLINFARRRLVRQLERQGASSSEIAAANEVLDPEMLTIGFARRFATYKRANLFLRNPERFLRIIKNAERPFQMIIAGKAHPQDQQGKEIIRSIIHFVKEHGLRNQVVYIEDYDINVARYMVQGVDCWLNTPRRPMEASGTSGMKAAANGALNISISDGWWCEAEHLGPNGWTIGGNATYANPDEQDHFDSESLYDILEDEVTHLYYDLSRDGIPRKWVAHMKSAIRTCCPLFNTHRMVQEYAKRFYIPTAVRRNRLREDGRKGSTQLTEWKQRVRAAWPGIVFKKIDCGASEGLAYGSQLEVSAEVDLGGLSASDVAVEIYTGQVEPNERITQGVPIPMRFQEPVKDSVASFKGTIPCDVTGQRGFMVRALPSHSDLAEKHEMGLITWA